MLKSYLVYCMFINNEYAFSKNSANIELMNRAGKKKNCNLKFCHCGHLIAQAIYIPGTSHCADMGDDTLDDPVELLEARLRISELVAKWLA